jgi:hypothetical protein
VQEQKQLVPTSFLIFVVHSALPFFVLASLAIRLQWQGAHIASS